MSASLRCSRIVVREPSIDCFFHTGRGGRVTVSVVDEEEGGAPEQAGTSNKNKKNNEYTTVVEAQEKEV